MRKILAGNNIPPPAIADIATESSVCGVAVRASGGRSEGIYIGGAYNLGAFIWLREGVGEIWAIASNDERLLPMDCDE